MALTITMLSLERQTKIPEVMSTNSLFLKLALLTGVGEGMIHTCAPLASGPQMSCTWVFVGGVLVFCFVLAQGLLLAWAS